MSSGDIDEKFVHKYISIDPLNKKFLKVDLKIEDKYWEEFLNESLEYSRDNKCWILIQTELKDFISLINNVDDDDKESSSESDSSDDELIQQTLKRRLTSESKQTVIEEDHVSDSHDEDVLSVTRRIRGIYKYIYSLEKRIKMLETKLN